MKTASQAGPTWGSRAAASGGAYLTGVQNTTKDQSTAAIAAKAIYASQVQAAIQKDSYAKGLQRSGKQGYLNGVQQKGQANYGTGVSTPAALARYTTNSGKYDAARGAASSIARGPKGSAQNLTRVSAVTNALHAAKAGATS